MLRELLGATGGFKNYITTAETILQHLVKLWRTHRSSLSEGKEPREAKTLL